MSDGPKQAGFEYEGDFIPWKLTDKVRDLQLIDHFAKMPPDEFFAAVEDDFDRSRTPVLTAMFATSYKHARPNWSVARVIRYVEDISMSKVVYFDGEDEDPEDEDGGEMLPLEEAPSAEDVEGSEGSSEKSSEQPDTPSET